VNSRNPSLQELYSLAQFLGYDSMIQDTYNLLFPHLTNEEFIDLAATAPSSLESIILDRVAQHFSDYAKCANFSELSLSTMLKLLKREPIRVESESALLHHLINWTLDRAKKENKKPKAILMDKINGESILGAVRLDLITSSEKQWVAEVGGIPNEEFQSYTKTIDKPSRLYGWVSETDRKFELSMHIPNFKAHLSDDKSQQYSKEFQFLGLTWNLYSGTLVRGVKHVGARHDRRKDYPSCPYQMEVILGSSYSERETGRIFQHEEDLASAYGIEPKLDKIPIPDSGIITLKVTMKCDLPS